jgi:hypothetical protein
MSRIEVPKTYDPGDMISLNAQFYKEDGTVGDPTTVVLKIRSPLGLQNTYTPTHDGVGAYSYDYETDLLDASGRYTYRFEGTGAITSAEEKAFYLNPSDFV